MDGDIEKKIVFTTLVCHHYHIYLMVYYTLLHGLVSSYLYGHCTGTLTIGRENNDKESERKENSIFSYPI